MIRTQVLPLRNLWTSWERAKAVIQVLQSKARSGLNRRAKHPEDSRTWKITSGWGINIQKASAALQKPRNAGGIQNMEAVEVRASVIAHSRALASNQGWLTIMTKDYLVSTMDWKPTVVDSTDTENSWTPGHSRTGSQPWTGFLKLLFWGTSQSVSYLVGLLNRKVSPGRKDRFRFTSGVTFDPLLGTASYTSSVWLKKPHTHTHNSVV